MKEIPLTKGFVALVDDADYAALSKYKWSVVGPGYARRRGKKSDGEREGLCIYMHREIMGLGRGREIEVDHIDRNKLNNQRSNLRTCTHSQNHCNIGARSRNTSGFKGVSFNKRKECWETRIRSGNLVKSFGGFKTPEEAYAKYCEEAARLHGEFANVGDHPSSPARREATRLKYAGVQHSSRPPRSRKKPNALTRKMFVTNTSGYRGVSWHAPSGKWQSRITIDGKRKTLGSFETAEAAYAVYCSAAQKIYGEFANLGN